MNKIDYSIKDSAERSAYGEYMATNRILNADLQEAQRKFDKLDAQAYAKYRAFVRKHRKELEASK